MPVFKGTNGQANVINWSSETGTKQSTIFASEFTSETKRTGIYIVEDAPLNLGGRKLVAYYDPGKPITLTNEGKNYDLNLQKLITTDPNFKTTINKQTRYHVTNGLTLKNPDGSIASRPSTIEVNRILGTVNPPATAPTGPGGGGAAAPGAAGVGAGVGGAQAPDEPTFASVATEDLSSQFTNSAKTPRGYYGKQVFRYPITQEGTFDYLKIDVVEYVKSSLISSSQTSLALARPSERLSTRPENNLVSIILPMQPNISDSNGVSWNEDQLNALQGAFASYAYGTIRNASSVQNFPDFMQWLASSGSQLSNVLGDIANSPGMSSLIAGYFAGQAVGANVIGRATGAVINNNLELLFQGPKLRTFRYSYRFTPREPSEAKEIKSIIKIFKREMATSHSDTGLFLQTPNVFRLKYIYNNGRESGKQHPFLNVIKPCALTNFSVNYTPDGTYMTYGDGGSMTAYQVDLEFSELEPIYKEDYDEQDSKLGMGY